MGRNLWDVLPRLIENQMVECLEGVMPTQDVIFELYKFCKLEGLWSFDLNQFETTLRTFYSLPSYLRSKAGIDQHLNRPLSFNDFKRFEIDFSNSNVPEAAKKNLSRWVSRIIETHKKKKMECSSASTLFKAFQRVIKPQFDHFCKAWKSVIDTELDSENKDYAEKLIKELHEIHQRLEKAEKENDESFLSPFLTSKEKENIRALLSSALQRKELPPLKIDSRDHPYLIDLEKVISLYRLVFNSRWPELIRHRENIIITLIDRCQRLL